MAGLDLFIGSNQLLTKPHRLPAVSMPSGYAAKGSVTGSTESLAVVESFNNHVDVVTVTATGPVMRGAPRAARPRGRRSPSG